MRTQTINGDKYFIIFIDDLSRMTWVCFLKQKSKALKMFKSFRKLVENDIGRQFKCLRYDRGGKFISRYFEKYYLKNGIQR